MKVTQSQKLPPELRLEFWPYVSFPFSMIWAASEWTERMQL